MNIDVKDTVIIGGGVSGMSAGIFSARLGLNTVLLERLMPGGQVINAEKVEDYPGFPNGVSGAELVGLMQEQAMSAGTDISLTEVMEIKTGDSGIEVVTYDSSILTRTVIIAGGSTLRKLSVPGEEKLEGSGVSYCATCDGAFFLDQKVCVIGGGDSAFEEALTLTDFASSVDIYCRESQPHAQAILQSKVDNNKKITIHCNTSVKEINGDQMVESISIVNSKTDEESIEQMSGVFIFVGLAPNTNYLDSILDLDPAGHIETDIWMRTKVEGLFASGDIRKNSASQLITCAGDGATSALSAFRYIKSGNWES
ncbi:MAG: NAD(P)/FAD-dependent oxidoreductase [Dehalococcoidia bacterium]